VFGRSKRAYECIIDSDIDIIDSVYMCQQCLEKHLWYKDDPWS